MAKNKTDETKMEPVDLDNTVQIREIESMIIPVRGTQVMLDRDLAGLYGVSTSRLNEQVKRNISRFPQSFRFQLTEQERDEVVANCDNLKTLKYNAQYAPIDVIVFQDAHDRFLCIDETVYHFGASLKDLGKKWFAFSKMEISTHELLGKLWGK